MMDDERAVEITKVGKMDVKTKNQDPWNECPPGELQRMAERLKIRQRRQALKRIGSAATALTVVSAGGYVAGRWLLGPAENRYGGIACSEVMPLLTDYRAKKLDPPLMRKIAAHLAECPHCGPMYRKMAAEMEGTA